VTWSNGARFFNSDWGLLAGRLADQIRDVGPLLVDDQGEFWAYADGLWRRDPREVQRRTVVLLGERWRPAHQRAVEGVLRASLGRFDVQPTADWINLPAGMLRWGEDPDPVLHAHDPALLSSVQLPIGWDPLAVCPEFDAFVEQAIPEDDRLRAWQVLGYLMLSGNPLQRLFMLTGAGGNGKGVYLNVLRALLGEANYSAVTLHDLSGENRFAPAELFGKLANICGDIDATFITNTGKIKQLSGDDKINAERKGEHPFKFLFWGKAIFSANAVPGAADSSRGWLRRWEVIRFPYTPSKPDPGLSDRIIGQELPGVAVKAVAALRQLMADGEFIRGESADNAHAEFAEKSNKVIRWINDPDSNVTRDPEIFNKGTILLQAFRQWEEFDQGAGGRATGVQRFNELVEQAGLRRTVRRGNRGYVGLRVAESVFVRQSDIPWKNYETQQIGSAPQDTQEDPLPGL
jgi:putative DNA primase/helicase